MKRLLFLVCGLLFTGSIQAQIFPDKVQDAATVNRVYLWDIPKTDKIYSIISQDTMRVTVMYTVYGKAVYVLTPSKAYQEIKAWFASALFGKTSQQNIKNYSLGEEFVVSYIGKLSLLTNKEIKRLEPNDQLVARAFNEKEKYTLLAEAPRAILGKRNRNGDIVPDFTIAPVAEVTH